MAFKIQFNKTFLQRISKELEMRKRALPILKSKEAALRVEVKNAKDHAAKLEKNLNEKIQAYRNIISLWSEFESDIVQVKQVDYSTKKIAGVSTPVLNDVEFKIKDFSLFSKPGWFRDGVEILKELTKLAVERDFFQKKMEILSQARKKTTQKVNLYEKVQIPQYEDAIRKIKRFMEDEENLSKSAQKIIKTKQQKEEAGT